MPILFSLSHTVCMCLIEFPRYDPKLMIRIRAHSHHTNQMYSICRTHISIYLNDFRMTFTIFNTSQFEYILSIPCKSQTRSQTHTECGKDKLLFSDDFYANYVLFFSSFFMLLKKTVSRS